MRRVDWIGMLLKKTIVACFNVEFDWRNAVKPNDYKDSRCPG